jgi:hypothetical protein
MLTEDCRAVKKAQPESFPRHVRSKRNPNPLIFLKISSYYQVSFGHQGGCARDARDRGRYQSKAGHG